MARDRVFSQQEQLAMAYVFTAAHPQGVTVKQVAEFYDWAAQVRLENGLLDLCIKGELMPSKGDDGEWAFQQTSDEVQENVKAILRGEPNR